MSRVGQLTLRLFRRPRLTSHVIAICGLLKHNGDLRRRGWFRSFRTATPVDADGEPLPWFTYAAIDFLEPRVRSDMRVFEYGSGHSTLWWAARVASVTSYEHDRGWYERLLNTLPANVEYHHVRLTPAEKYAAGCAEAGVRFDIIVIDGRHRVACAKHAVSALKEDGVIIWDNTNRSSYDEGCTGLMASGFKRIDFAGMGPADFCGWTTSVFYRQQNCLGI